MNVGQTVFTVFFAIAWGIVSNVMPRWKPFNYALCFRQGYRLATVRLVVAFILLNILPWLACAFVLFVLRTEADMPKNWTRDQYFALVIRAMLPGLMPFGFYRLWIATCECCPRCFYPQHQNGVPEIFRTDAGKVPIEPDIDYLHLNNDGAVRNLLVGLAYIVVGLLSPFVA
jgi:hypothetical protein